MCLKIKRNQTKTILFPHTNNLISMPICGVSNNHVVYLTFPPTLIFSEPFVSAKFVNLLVPNICANPFLDYYLIRIEYFKMKTHK